MPCSALYRAGVSGPIGWFRPDTLHLAVKDARAGWPGLLSLLIISDHCLTMFVAIDLNRCRHFAFGSLARLRTRVGSRRWLGICALQFNFLGYRRDGVADLSDNALQYIRRNPKPPGPGTNLSRIRQVYLVANWRMFDALHDGTPWLRINGIRRASFHFGHDPRQNDKATRRRPCRPVLQAHR